MRRWLTSGLLQRILLALLVVAFVPFGINAYAGTRSFEQSKEDVVAKSREDASKQAFANLQTRTNAVANDVAIFLRERETDVRVAASLPQTAEALLAFARAKNGQIWTINPEGQEVRLQVPLYREVAFIDSSGDEVVKVINDCENYPFICQSVVSTQLTNVRSPKSTLFQAETYFQEAISLTEDTVFVGRVTGRYISPRVAYAGAQNRTGERYRGVIRFAMPVFQNGKKTGVVVLAVETIHLIELTSHVSPANPALIAEVDPREADFAYMVDPEGWAISHPRHFNIIGVDDTGALVPSISETRRDDPDNLYRPGKLTEMGFISPALPEIVQKNQRGESGALTGSVWKGQERALAFATIPYFTSTYNTPAGFGAVILSTDSGRFSLASDLLGKQIQNRSAELSSQMQWLSMLTVILSLLLAVFLARSVAWPVLKLTDSAQKIQDGQWEQANLEFLSGRSGNDEISRLSRVFSSMAMEVRTREMKMKQEIQALKIVIEEKKVRAEVERITESQFFTDLTARARQMRQSREERFRKPDDEPTDSHQ